MNPRTRKVALYALGTIAILASANALAHSYAGLYQWAAHHRLTGWQAKSWPAEIDVFLAVGELALYVAYLDGWPTRQRVWPWMTALAGLAVSVAGNVGHIQAGPGHAVSLTDRLTAAASPLAAFAGLTIGLLVLKMTRSTGTTPTAGDQAPPALAANSDMSGVPTDGQDGTGTLVGTIAGKPDAHLLQAASSICQDAAARGEQLSQRSLARELRDHGHRFPNEQLHQIARGVGLTRTAPKRYVVVHEADVTFDGRSTAWKPSSSSSPDFASQGRRCRAPWLFVSRRSRASG